jgi:hypothetical protein
VTAIHSSGLFLAEGPGAFPEECGEEHMGIERSEPILPARDLAGTRAFYQSLGFKAGYNDDKYDILWYAAAYGAGG